MFNTSYNFTITETICVVIPPHQTQYRLNNGSTALEPLLGNRHDDTLPYKGPCQPPLCPFLPPWEEEEEAGAGGHPWARAPPPCVR